MAGSCSPQILMGKFLRTTGPLGPCEPQKCKGSDAAAQEAAAASGYGIAEQPHPAPPPGWLGSLSGSWLHLPAGDALLGGPKSAAATATKSSSSSSSALAAAAAATLQQLAAELGKARRLFTEPEGDLEACARTEAFALFSVTIRRPLTPAKAAAILCSYAPVLLMLVLLAAAAFTRAVFPIYAVVSLAAASVLNERVLKQLIDQPRPAGSLVETPGMPSSHCLVSFMFLVLLAAELLLRPVLSVHSAAAAAACALALAPMPWARAHLRDHTPLQCYLGCLAGALCGLCAAALRLCLLPG